MRVRLVKLCLDYEKSLGANLIEAQHQSDECIFIGGGFACRLLTSESVWSSRLSNDEIYES